MSKCRMNPHFGQVRINTWAVSTGIVLRFTFVERMDDRDVGAELKRRLDEIRERHRAVAGMEFPISGDNNER